MVTDESASVRPSLLLSLAQAICRLMWAKYCFSDGTTSTWKKAGSVALFKALQSPDDTVTYAATLLLRAVLILVCLTPSLSLPP